MFQRRVVEAAHGDDAYCRLDHEAKKEFERNLAVVFFRTARSATRLGFESGMKALKDLSPPGHAKAESWDVNQWAWYTFDFSCMLRGDSNDAETSFGPYSAAKRKLAVPELLRLVLVDLYTK